MQDRVSRLLERRRVVVCAGAGGVGKTTVAAALALAAAGVGRHVLCLTIDPAKRLADSLGLTLAPGIESEVAPERLAAAGLGRGGRLSVAMLDPKSTFDELVVKHASSPAAAERILQNQFYRHVSTSLAGTQSYMAMEKVLSVRNSDRYDSIVLDTPPTGEALDFLDAPERLVEALDSPAMRWLVQAFEPAGGFSMRLLARGVAVLLRTMGRLTGRGFLESMAAFVAELNELFGGFKERANEVSRAFRTPEFGYVLVAAPQATALAEARYFAERLERLGRRADAFVLNRVHQVGSAHGLVTGEVTRRLVALGAPASATAAALQAYEHEAARARLEQPAIARWREAMGEARASELWTIPVMAGDVRGIADLAKVSRALAQP
jgi:anion-transporting  ArsA/GET3 family ATPase